MEIVKRKGKVRYMTLNKGVELNANRGIAIPRRLTFSNKVFVLSDIPSLGKANLVNINQISNTLLLLLGVIKSFLNGSSYLNKKRCNFISNTHSLR